MPFERESSPRILTIVLTVLTLGLCVSCSGESTQDEAEAMTASETYAAGMTKTDELGHITWQKEFETAVREAKAAGRPVMIDFYATWCGPCKMMDRSTFKDELVIEKSREFVCIKVDGGRHRNLMRRYRVYAYPTMLFLDPDLNEIERAVGYRDARRLGNLMEKVLRKVEVGAGD